MVGRRPALEAIRSGSAEELLVARGSADSPVLRRLLEAAAGAGVPVTRVAPDALERLAPGARHQGVAVRASGPREVGEAELATHPWPGDAVVLVLDGVTDPHNLGAAARSAEAAGASALVLPRRRAAGLTATSMKASAGALAHLPVAQVPNVPRALERLKGAGFWVVGLDASAAGSVLEATRPPGRLALVVGSEGRGLSRLAAARCDELLSIPMRGRVESLNVSVAAAVALFTYALRER